MKIIDRSFADNDPAVLINMVQNSKSIQEAFGKGYLTIDKWAIIDQEVENRNPVLYILTDQGCFFTTSSVITKRLQEYQDKATARNIPLPRARFYKGTSQGNGRTFYAIYFEQML